MDFDYCKVCTSTCLPCQNNRPQIQGQGDCKCNHEVNKNEWICPNKTKNFRSKIARETNGSEVKTERPKSVEDGGCNCFGKQKDKPKHDSKQEKDFFEDANYFWDSSPVKQWNARTKNGKVLQDEQPKFSIYPNNEKMLTQNVLEFEEKVDFLFRIFKDHGQKFPNDGFGQNPQMQGTEGILQDISRLFHFNKRLCAAEEDIENLALILEDLVKDTSKKKAEENYMDSVNFDALSVAQRLNYLKSRNDLMLNFMSAFLKAGFTEESCAMRAPLPKLSDTKLDRVEKFQSKDLNRVRIMETLQKLRMRITDLRQKELQFFNAQHMSKSEKEEEVGSKFARNNLEAILEQAELVLSDESENVADYFGGKSAAEILNERLSEINEESDESDLSVHDVTLKIMAEGTEFLKTSLDKSFFSKRDLSEPKLNNGNSSQEECKALQEECKKADETNHEAVSELNCFFHDVETPEKPKERNKSVSCGANFTKPRETREVWKKQSPEKTAKDLFKGSKKPEEGPESQASRRTSPEDIEAIFPIRGTQGGERSVSHNSAPSCEPRKQEMRRKEKTQRPLTDPISHRKPPTGLKTSVEEKITTRNSSINNVKIRNKILLSKKPCVEKP